MTISVPFVNESGSFSLNKGYQHISPHSNRSDPLVSVEINPNNELISIILSYTSWSNTFGISKDINYSYRDDINISFGGEKLHPAIIQASNLQYLGFSAQIPSKFILHYGSPPSLTLRCNYSDDILLKEVGEIRLNALAEEIRDFALVTNFSDFYISHQSFYNSIISDFTTIYNWTEAIITLETFFGLSKSNYTIILAPFMFLGGGFAVWIGDENDTHLYSIVRTWGIQNNMPYFGTPINIVEIVLHEFAHGFVNPIVDAHMDQFEAYSDLYLVVEDNMTQMLYSNWQAMLHETFVRAFTAWFINEEYGEVKAKERLDLEEKRGFYFIRDIYNSYVEFMEKRNQYSTFDHFIPEILKKLDEILSQSKNSTRKTYIVNFIETFLILCIFSLIFRKKSRK
ncbi:MAG: DUF4932 domain-containing protein [Promethearchaeota archaeon]